jgi:hypothetical protein
MTMMRVFAADISRAFSDEVTMTRQRTEEQKNGCRNKEAVDEVGNQGRYEHRRNDDEEVGEDEEQRSRR